MRKQIERNQRLQKFGTMGTPELIEWAQRLARFVQFSKIFLAIIIVASYFYLPEFLIEILAIALIVTLIVPQGFMHNFLQCLIEYNTSTLEDRIVLNSRETDLFLRKIDEKICNFDQRIKNIENDG